MQSMGMQSGQLPDAQITSYTETNAAWRAANGRLYFEKVLNREGAWRAGANDVHQWFQVDFGGWAKIVRVATQGRHDGNEWVKSYTLSFGYDGVFFEPYKQSGRTAVRTNIPTYTPTYFPTFPFYIPIYLSIYLPTYLPTFLPTYLPTFLPTYLPTFLPT